MHVQPGTNTLLQKTKQYGLLLNYPPDLFGHHTFYKDAVAPSGCQSRTIKSRHHAQDCPWRSSMLSYREF